MNEFKDTICDFWDPPGLAQDPHETRKKVYKQARDSLRPSLFQKFNNKINNLYKSTIQT